MIENIEYRFSPGCSASANKDFLLQCSELYSNHYGIWSAQGIHPGQHIRLSTDRLRQWLENDIVTIYYATHKEALIGYAIAFSKDEPNCGIVTWVTQLVVHKEYRRHGIARNILFSIWGFSNHFAWGIVSANPYAIRALEKATRRRAIPLRIQKNARQLKTIGYKNVPFINESTEFQITDTSSAVNTEFYVDHSDTLQMLENVISENVPWNLGLIAEGWEWFAFTFNDQQQIALTQEEIENMVTASDSVVKQAYAKMNLDPREQKWMKNTIAEIDFITKNANICPNDLVYDLGCGIGRHSIELAKRNIETIGIDYIPQHISSANKKIQELSLSNIQILEGDCRYFTSGRKASAVLCLYDVIGSFATDSDNLMIIKAAYSLLKPGGFAIFSVMNYEATATQAKHFFSFENDADKLLSLKASATMEKSGNVFEPDFYLVDKDTHLIYRKEQFSLNAELPTELIVRDRRFTIDEITSMCQSIGFSIQKAFCTNASDWEKTYEPSNPRAKEILLICQKPKAPDILA